MNPNKNSSKGEIICFLASYRVKKQSLGSMKTTNPSDHKNVVSEKNGKALLHIIDPLCNFEVVTLHTICFFENTLKSHAICFPVFKSWFFPYLGRMGTRESECGKHSGACVGWTSCQSFLALISGKKRIVIEVKANHNPPFTSYYQHLDTCPTRLFYM